jgi:AraC-like DNA-binding protein
MSPSTLQRVFKQCLGMTVGEFMRIRRLERARAELAAGACRVGEAAYRAGYRSAANFATAFRQEFGFPPSHYLRE